ncbi:MAG: YhjD/YihY/BrkB family envelope integrity protein [Pseudomonadota bacterium]|nr:YhjD/YihY/BrkB family envelope integrity protein [Pseudomonadota bacterium]
MATKQPDWWSLDWLEHRLFADDQEAPWWQRGLRRVAQVLYACVRDLIEGQIQLHAMSLVYTTLLSLVPLLALSFSVLKSFGVHNRMEPLLYNFLAPLGARAEEIGTRLVGFVENMNVAVLGTIGLGFLIYTTVSLVQKIEASFNFLWNVRQQRSLSQVLSYYLSLILVGPVAVVVLLGVIATMMNSSLVRYLGSSDLLGWAFVVAAQVLPMVLVMGGITAVYMLVPNTRVKPPAAFGGALVATLLWQVVGGVFSAVVVSSTRYAAIYSSFAILILLLIWLFLSWLILLVGANIAFYLQHPRLTRGGRSGVWVSAELKEYLGLWLMVEAVAQHRVGRSLSVHDLCAERGIAPQAATEVVALLVKAGLLVQVADESGDYRPGRAADQVELTELLELVRSAGSDDECLTSELRMQAPIDPWFERYEQAGRAALSGVTLAEVVTAEDAVQTPDQ